MKWLLTWLINHTTAVRFVIDGVEYWVTNGRNGPLVSAKVRLTSFPNSYYGVEIEPANSEVSEPDRSEFDWNQRSPESNSWQEQCNH